MIEKKKYTTAKMRVKQERNELFVKLSDLLTYLKEEGENAQQRDLLLAQADIMQDYLDILNERLIIWDENE